MNVHGKRVLITGASGGLGQAIARTLAAHGARLVLSARNEEVLARLSAETGGEVVIADLAVREDVARLADLAGDLDVLVANAGVGADSPITEVTDAEIDARIDVNLRAPISLATAFAQAHLAAGTPGHIVFVGSLSGLAATPETRMYNATKFGLRGYAHSLRQDLAEHHIGVTHVAPGFIRDAGMFHNGNIELPSIVRTKTPQDVAAGVLKGIRSNTAEVFVSPVELRLSATFSTVAPSLSARLQRRLDAAGRKRNERVASPGPHAVTESVDRGPV